MVVTKALKYGPPMPTLEIVMAGRNVTGKIQDNLRARLDNARNTVQKTIANGRALVGDVRTRFDLSSDKEPKNFKLGGVFGSRGDLTESAAGLLVKEKDIMSEHVQTAANINRRMLQK